MSKYRLKVAASSNAYDKTIAFESRDQRGRVVSVPEFQTNRNLIQSHAIPNKCYKSQVYKEAVEKWQHRSEFYRPSRGNEVARARFFAAVDEACKTESRTPENCYLITFACSAAIQVVVDQDLVKLCESDRCHVLNESERLCMVRLGIVLPPTSNSSAAARLPPHLVSAFFPETQPAAFGKLVGKQVSYQDPRSGITREYTVTDKITNYIRGTYYLITDGEGCNEEVNEDEMRGILGNAVP